MLEEALNCSLISYFGEPRCSSIMTGCQLMLHEDVHKITIAFRGTDKFGECISNLLGDLTNYHGCKVHAGFLLQYRSVCNELYKVLQRHANKAILVTGHGIGGAVAHLCALDLSIRNNAFVTCVTFGSPKVGDQTFKDKFLKHVYKSVRKANTFDVFTWLPLSLVHVTPADCSIPLVMNPHSIRAYRIDLMASTKNVFF